MTDTSINAPPSGTNPIDATEVTTGAGTVIRVRQSIGAADSDFDWGIKSDGSGPVRPTGAVSGTGSPSPFNNGDSATKGFAKASAGNLYSLSCSNANASLRYLQVFNKATAPTAGVDTPLWSEILPPGTPTDPSIRTWNTLDFGLNGWQPGGAGVAWALSTTPWTFTDSATASEHHLQGMVL